MKYLFILLFLIPFSVSAVDFNQGPYLGYDNTQEQYNYDIELNAYGQGVGQDQYGRTVQHDPLLEVTPDTYGPNVGMDQYGRPVYGNQ